jgi:hypothetical protein
MFKYLLPLFLSSNAGAQALVAIDALTPNAGTSIWVYVGVAVAVAALLYYFLVYKKKQAAAAPVVVPVAALTTAHTALASAHTALAALIAKIEPTKSAPAKTPVRLV